MAAIPEPAAPAPRKVRGEPKALKDLATEPTAADYTAAAKTWRDYAPSPYTRLLEAKAEA